jgi:hypothetical protein
LSRGDNSVDVWLQDVKPRLISHAELCRREPPSSRALPRHHPPLEFLVPAESETELADFWLPVVGAVCRTVGRPAPAHES